MKNSHPVATVEEWQAAVNAQDRERLLALSAGDIEIVGPRNSTGLSDADQIIPL